MNRNYRFNVRIKQFAYLMWAAYHLSSGFSTKPLATGSAKSAYRKRTCL